MTANFNLFILDVVSSGSSSTIAKETLSGFPRLFAGNDVYVYKINGGLLKPNGTSYTNVLPSNGSYVSSITSIPNGAENVTVIFGYTHTFSGTPYYTLQYTNYPEGVGQTWSSGSSVSDDFTPVDSVSDYLGFVNVLTGNSNQLNGGTGIRILSTSGSAPYPFSASDSGIPNTPGSAAILTDLEIAQ